MTIRAAAASFAVAVLLGACSSAAPGHGATASTTTPTAVSSGPRPSSPAVVKILEPKNGSVVPGIGATMKVSLHGAKLVTATSSTIVPTEGHLHVYVDDQLITMTSGLTQTLPNLEPGTHVLRVEFVASDHAPFDPRVVTQAVFEVA
jgi:hypothetical protein